MSGGREYHTLSNASANYTNGAIVSDDVFPAFGAPMGHGPQAIVN